LLEVVAIGRKNAGWESNSDDVLNDVLDDKNGDDLIVVLGYFLDGVLNYVLDDIFAKVLSR
jgi:hypothetical protein